MNYNEIKWTDEENIFLKTNINKLTCSEMAKILNHSNSATRLQIVKLLKKLNYIWRLFTKIQLYQKNQKR